MNIDQIIGKLMGEGYGGEEKSALEAWKKEAEENIKALEEIQKIASFSNSLQGYQDFNTDQEWESFEKNMIEDNAESITDNLKVDSESNTTASIFSLKFMARIAAIMVVVLGSLFLINTFTNSDDGTVDTKAYSAATEMMEFDLKDGTNVTLDKKSDLQVIDERTVSLVGRAHFDVKRDETKQFSIDLPVGKVTVLGTEFTIDADENTTEVYVTEGSVRYELADHTFILEAGELVKVTNNEPVVLKGKNDNYDSWKNQRLIFRDSNMEEVVLALSKHFKKDVLIEEEYKKNFINCNVMDVFTNASINDILNELSISHGLKYEIRENKVYIVSAKC